MSGNHQKGKGWAAQVALTREGLHGWGESQQWQVRWGQWCEAEVMEWLYFHTVHPLHVGRPLWRYGIRLVDHHGVQHFHPHYHRHGGKG